MNLKAFNNDGTALYCRNCRSKEDARTIILNHGMLAHTEYVMFKNVRYTIGMVYKW